MVAKPRASPIFVHLLRIRPQTALRVEHQDAPAFHEGSVLGFLGFWFQGFRVSGFKVSRFHPNRGRGRDRYRDRDRLFHHGTLSWVSGFRVSGFHPNRYRDRYRYRDRLFNHEHTGWHCSGFYPQIYTDYADFLGIARVFLERQGEFLIFMKFHVFRGFIQIGVGIAIAIGIGCFTTGHFLGFLVAKGRPGLLN